MATHSSILAWEIPWTEEPGGLQSIRSQIVGHDWAQKSTTILESFKANVLSDQINKLGKERKIIKRKS